MFSFPPAVPLERLMIPAVPVSTLLSTLTLYPHYLPLCSHWHNTWAVIRILVNSCSLDLAWSCLLQRHAVFKWCFRSWSDMMPTIHFGLYLCLSVSNWWDCKQPFSLIPPLYLWLLKLLAQHMLNTLRNNSATAGCSLCALRYFCKMMNLRGPQPEIMVIKYRSDKVTAHELNCNYSAQIRYQ